MLVFVKAQLPDRKKGITRAKTNRRAEEYFWYQRSYPSMVRPYDQMLRAKQSVLSGRYPPFSLSIAADASWRPLGPTALFDFDVGYYGGGPQADAGRITSIAPVASGTTIFVGTAAGGVWRSKDQWLFLVTDDGRPVRANHWSGHGGPGESQHRLCWHGRVQS